MSMEIEAAIAREQERLIRLLELVRAGEVAKAPRAQSIAELLARITATIDQIELEVGAADATRT